MNIIQDFDTAQAFASSWNNLRAGSIYTKDQVCDWFLPLEKNDIEGKTILELGCGNASLLLHILDWAPRYAVGVDLGDSVISAMANVGGYDNCKIIKADITNFRSEGYDVVYCIGVIHHLKVPRDGFESVIKNTKKGGKFHMWVYAREGNALIIYIVDPIRKITSKLPWFITKYLVATPLAIPFYIYAKLIRYLKGISIFKHLPLYQYGLWISDREFVFFQHVAFDQLVTPQTTYISKEVIVDWLKSMPEIDQSSTYVIMRNGNSWKFGGVVN
jgi:SAM-dependent methyltransferase